MAPDVAVTHLPIILRADPARVVLRPFIPADDPPSTDKPNRAQRLTERVMALCDQAVAAELDRVVASLSDRHRDIAAVLLRRFQEVSGAIGRAQPVPGAEPMIDPQPESGQQVLSDARRRLIGAYFCEEYSFEAAALFNPSIVAHPDQTRLPPGCLRFVLSLRGVGEGHISSITFRSGIIGADGSVVMDPASIQAISPHIAFIPGDIPDDSALRLSCAESRDISEIVIFPVTLHQQHGIEDLRLVRFVEDDSSVTWLGTYTAYGEGQIRAELLSTTDFSTFELIPLRGPASVNKGLALFPRRIAGQYAMIGRIDHENIWLLRSNDLIHWDSGKKILCPRQVWEFVQLGNCGSPIEIAEGWLVLIHGVGPVRNYCIGACLLDKTDPGKVLKRLAAPLLRPSEQERDGYVPNVIYSCGGMVNGRTLILPYAVADSFTTFATLALDDLLAAMD
ncbi:glycoside hydrolase family 130 protein [Novosphingobium sp.]|uniref:glycoside hydrolase family 130 protein n=1 Tax=Novosphingobium sp. TaxID=1874826 RepID=UPI003B527EC5